MSGPGYGCALGDESHPVNWLITRLKPASTLSLCDEDFAPGLIHVLATDLGTDPERLYAAIERHVDREKARQDKEAAKAAAAAVDAAPAGPDEPALPELMPGDALPGQDDEYDAMMGRDSADLT